MKNTEKKNKRQKSMKRSQVLENQIETMLDDIMKEEDEEEINFKFSDDDSSSENKSDNLLIYLPEENEIFSNLSYNNSQSDIDTNNINLFPYYRSNKKYSTVSFQNEQFENVNNNKSNLSLFSPNNSFRNNYNGINQNGQNPKSSFFQNNNTINQKSSFYSTNYSINTGNLSRDDQRKNTYDLKNNNNSILENNINMNINNSMCNGIPNYYNINNVNPNFFLMNKNLNIQKIGFNNNLLLNPDNNNITLCNNINNNFINQDFNMNNNQLPKKFFTTSIPERTNMHVEILLYELNSALTKNEKIDYFIYNKLKGNFVNIIKTHRGSRIFQNYLKNTHSDIIHQIFTEINPSLIELIIDPYANYFCKRFFNFLNQKDRIDFLLSINNSLIKLSINNIGTYPIQGIIEQLISKNEKKIIINSIKDYINELCYDTYGTHVLEKIISCFEEEFTGFIFDFVENNFLNLANHINGICIVKKILSLTHKKDIHEKLKKIINENALILIQHIYGNYVIQIVVETWDLNDILEILSNFKNKYTMLSMSKYSSNVVEKCIEKNQIILKEYINEICDNGKIAEIMKNNFGNYVIQKALKLSLGIDKKKLSEEVEKNIFKLNDKKLILKWKSIVSSHLESKFNNEKSSV